MPWPMTCWQKVDYTNSNLGLERPCAFPPVLLCVSFAMRGARPGYRPPRRMQDTWSRVTPAAAAWSRAHFCTPLSIAGHSSCSKPQPSQLILYKSILHPRLLLWIYISFNPASVLGCSPATGSVANSGHMTSTIFPDRTSLGPESHVNYACKLPQESVTKWGIKPVIRRIWY